MSTQNARSGMPRRVVVIGAGGAGSAAAQVLSQAAQDLHVVVVGQEDRPPYNRTTVNKGAKAVNRIRPLSGARPQPTWSRRHDQADRLRHGTDQPQARAVVSRRDRRRRGRRRMRAGVQERRIWMALTRGNGAGIDRSRHVQPWGMRPAVTTRGEP